MLTNLFDREEIHGQTPLYIAAQTGQYTIARSIVQKGVDVSIKTSSGDTAYHVALRNGYSAIAQIITEKEKEQQQQKQMCETSELPISPPLPVQSNRNSLLGQQLPQPTIITTSTTSIAPIVATHIPRTRPNPPTHLNIPAPTQFKPKSPYTAFFDRFAQFKEAEAEDASNMIPEVIVHDVNDVPIEAQWYLEPSPGDITRYSPEGVESAKDALNIFNAWPGTSVVYKKPAAVTTTNHKTHQVVGFKRSISKPPTQIGCKTPATPMSPWSPSHERYPAIGSQEVKSCPPYETAGEQVKLPKDLSSVLANLGLTKYQEKFEEQDIDLQVKSNALPPQLSIEILIF